jgi:plasmid maintenance system antidote protein VapI
MGIPLSKVFGSSANAWLGLQAAYDPAQARSRARNIKVRSFKW